MSADPKTMAWKPRKILKDKTVLVTGCASGIGLETARLAKAMGAHVIGVDIRKTDQHVDELYVADLSDGPTIQALLAVLPDGIDGLANMAGPPPTAPAEQTLAVSLLGLRALTAGVIGKLNDGAAIVNLASIFGMDWPEAVEAIRACDHLDFEDLAAFVDQHKLDGDPGRAHLLARQALIAWTLKNRWAWRDRGIRMNCVSPGLVDSPVLKDTIQALGLQADEEARLVERPATPADIAPVVAFLLSDMSAWIRGANIPVDGGMASHILCSRHGL